MSGECNFGSHGPVHFIPFFVSSDRTLSIFSKAARRTEYCDITKSVGLIMILNFHLEHFSTL
jgi:hypothetical protein